MSESPEKRKISRRDFLRGVAATGAAAAAGGAAMEKAQAQEGDLPPGFDQMAEATLELLIKKPLFERLDKTRDALKASGKAYLIGGPRYLDYENFAQSFLAETLGRRGKELELFARQLLAEWAVRNNEVPLYGADGKERQRNPEESAEEKIYSIAEEPPEF